MVYITNAINLIDGIDGLASGLCCIALSVLGLVFLYVHQPIYALLAICTFGVLIPFWCYNVFGNAKRGHKLFMGDAGSLTLGYVPACASARTRSCRTRTISTTSCCARACVCGW